MKNKHLYVFFIFQIFLCTMNIAFGQETVNILTVEKTEISGGAEFSEFLENERKYGSIDKYQYKSNTVNKKAPNEINALTAILGVDFDTDASTTGFYHIPPDPIGVAGPSHLVAVNNTSIRWSDKSGGSVTTKRLGKNGSTHVGSFFESLTPVNGTFDPKVIYDQYNSRFVVVTLEKVSNGDDADDVNNTSRILVAVSATSDPTGTWYYTAINSKITIGGFETWADYPGFSVNTDAIFITNNMFSFGGSSKGERLWIITKGVGSGGFYDSGGTAVVNIYDPPATSGYTITYQPAHMFGSAPSSVLTYLVGYSSLSDGTNEYISVISVTGTHASATLEATLVSLGDIENTSTAMPDAPQSGTATLVETNNRRAMQAIWRSNALWAVTTIVNSSTEATVHWVKATASSSTPSTPISDQGDIGGEGIATGTHTFMPSIAVNSSGDMIVGFAASASTIFPGAYYAGRLSGDGAGTTNSAVVVKAGLAYYVRTFGSSRNRWGDYSGMSIDPSDDATFWVFNQYAMTQGTDLGGGLGRWGTVFAKVVDSPFPVEITSFTSNQKSNSIILNWTTATEINNYGFSIERKSTIENREWEDVAFIEGHGNSNSIKNYSFIDNSAEGGLVKYRLKQIDTDGSFEYSDEIELVFNKSYKYSLEQNHPNPFNPTTMINYSIKNNSKVVVDIYNTLGQKVVELFSGTLNKGKHSVSWNASGFSSGTYFARFTATSLSNNETYSEVKKLLLLK